MQFFHSLLPLANILILSTVFRLALPNSLFCCNKIFLGPPLLLLPFILISCILLSSLFWYILIICLYHPSSFSYIFSVMGFCCTIFLILSFTILPQFVFPTIRFKYLIFSILLHYQFSLT